MPSHLRKGEGAPCATVAPASKSPVTKLARSDKSHAAASTTARGFGRPEAQGIGLSIVLSQSDLAQMVGALRQTVNRILQQFHHEGILSTIGGRPIIHSIERLRGKLALDSGLGTHDQAEA